MKTMKSDDVDRIVEKLDETRMAEFFRVPDRPNGRAMTRLQRRQDPAIGKARARIRTAHCRVRLDQAKRPSTSQIGMALVKALVTSPSSIMTRSDWNLVGRALADLQSRGFDLLEVRSALRKLRDQFVDPADRNGDVAGNPAPRF